MGLQHVDRALRLQVEHGYDARVVSGYYFAARLVPHADQPDAALAFPRCDYFRKFLLAGCAHVVNRDLTVYLAHAEQVVDHLEAADLTRRLRLQLRDQLHRRLVAPEKDASVVVRRADAPALRDLDQSLEGVLVRVDGVDGLQLVTRGDFRNEQSALVRNRDDLVRLRKGYHAHYPIVLVFDYSKLHQTKVSLSKALPRRRCRSLLS